MDEYYIINPLIIADMIRVSLGDAMSFTFDLKASKINLNFDSEDDLDEILEVLTNNYGCDFNIILNLITIFDNALDSENRNSYFDNRFNLIRYLSQLGLNKDEDSFSSCLLTLIRLISDCIKKATLEEINILIKMINLLESASYQKALDVFLEEDNILILKALAILVNLPPIDGKSDFEIFNKTKEEVAYIAIDRLLLTLNCFKEKEIFEESEAFWENNLNFQNQALIKTFTINNIH